VHLEIDVLDSAKPLSNSVVTAEDLVLRKWRAPLDRRVQSMKQRLQPMFVVRLVSGTHQLD